MDNRISCTSGVPSKYIVVDGKVTLRTPTSSGGNELFSPVGPPRLSVETQASVMEEQIEERSSGAVDIPSARSAVSPPPTPSFQQEASPEIVVVDLANDDRDDEVPMQDEDNERLRLATEKFQRINNGIVAKIWRNIKLINLAINNNLNPQLPSSGSEEVVEIEDDSEDSEEETQKSCKDDVFKKDESRSELKSQNDAPLRQQSPILIDLTDSDNPSDGVASEASPVIRLPFGIPGGRDEGIEGSFDCMKEESSAVNVMEPGVPNTLVNIDDLSIERGREAQTKEYADEGSATKLQNVEGVSGKSGSALGDIPAAGDEVILAANERPVSPVPGPSAKIPKIEVVEISDDSDDDVVEIGERFPGKE
ncbi:unnamed protein product [Orchesella dallaii]|uniref:Uncharacterized protein n=1 Tax=Orchesella dallaii TaxID=48710 RepID=A0ABP1PS68_9HEXA